MPANPPPPAWLVALEREATAGSGAALLELARLYLVGRDVPRDLPRARGYFAQAAAAGEQAAAAVYRAFVANGTGGASDWPGALRLLEADRADPDAAEQLALIAAMALDDTGAGPTSLVGEQLSTTPRILLFRGFLSNAEADYLVARATPRFQPALVVHPVTRQQIPDPIRTSNVAAFPLALEQPAIHAINRRIAAASQTDVLAGEPLTVLRYRPGQQYRAHLDTLPRVDNQRLATMLVYLNDGYRGGETHFPKIGLKVRAQKGDALLFYNLLEDGQPDPMTLHEGMVVSAGEKLVASRWIRKSRLTL
ncbi:peptidyl prolyl 4-hydroxylase subunit alpha [Sphingomonas glacialis]|uniref:Peptidyl prolyl 4-hydroxylase subunit alpha n=2 Tax=Sphingomonas glacialis TaxID=658225 RepID=A0A502FJY2_9SPHN|nr:peptidyl prolyl 4-hydroxylase subunit alpha [Sphingomonas glacialis]